MVATLAAGYAPGPGPATMFSNITKMRQDSAGFLLNLARQYGDVVHFRMGKAHIHLVSDPELLHTMLIDNADTFPRGSITRELFSQVLGLGLLTTDGQYHRQQRKLAQPSFHHKRVMTYGDVMVKLAVKRGDSWQSGQIYDVAHEMTEYTFGIVTQTLFNTNMAEAYAESPVRRMTVNANNYLRQKRMSLFTLPLWVPTPLNRNYKQAMQDADQLTMRIIKEHRESGQDNGDLLSMLMQVEDEDNGKKMSDEQLLGESKGILAAGHETTASTLSFCWYLLSQHPEVEAKLHEELAQVLAGRLPTAEDYPKLVYTSAIIKEVLRLYPPSWIFNREPAHDVTLGGYSMRKGELIFISPYVMGHSKRYFDEPDTFKPERWLDGLEKRLPRLVYIPFGSGPHICIGQQFAQMESLLTVATMAQRFRMEAVPGYQFMTQVFGTMQPKGALPMKIVAR